MRPTYSAYLVLVLTHPGDGVAIVSRFDIFSAPAGSLTLSFKDTGIDLDSQVANSYQEARDILLDRTRSNPLFRHLLQFLPAESYEEHSNQYPHQLLRESLNALLKDLMHLEKEETPALEEYPFAITDILNSFSRTLTRRFKSLMKLPKDNTRDSSQNEG